MRDDDEALSMFVAPLLSADCPVIVLADHGFGPVRFFRFLDGFGWDWVMRGKGNICVRGKKRLASDLPAREGTPAAMG